MNDQPEYVIEPLGLEYHDGKRTVYRIKFLEPSEDEQELWAYPVPDYFETKAAAQARIDEILGTQSN